MIKIAVCDDEENAVKKIKGILCELVSEKDAEVAEYFNGEDIIYDLENGKCFDLVLLDLSMNNIDGIEVATYIREKTICRSCEIIFITSYTADVSKVVDLNPVAYIYKNELEEKLRMKAKKIIDSLKKENVLRIMSKRQNVIIDYKNIMYIEALLGILEIHTQEEVIKTRSIGINKLSEIMDKSVLVRCHQSYVINKSFVKRITSKEVVMYNNVIIPISRRYKNEVMK